MVNGYAIVMLAADSSLTRKIPANYVAEPVAASIIIASVIVSPVHRCRTRTETARDESDDVTPDEN